MAAPIRISLLLSLLTACGFPRPADVDDNASGDASASGITVHVSPTGDDVNDGLTQPVRTIKRAIGIAAASADRATIGLAAGRYGATTGELFPSTVPPDVTVAGPAGGGAILVGSKVEAGLVLDTGKLQNLEFEDFAVAITARGSGELANVRVRTSGIALREETTAKLTVSNLDIMGAAGACARGIELNGNAELTATDLATRALGTTVLARDQVAVNFLRATVSGDSSCMSAAFDIESNRSLTLSESLVDSGYFGIILLATGMPTQVMLKNVVIRNTKAGAMSGHNAVVQMVGGELSYSENAGVDIFNANFRLTEVAIKHNALGIYAQNSTLIMRGCMVTGNRGGVDLGFSSSADFGTIADPGNNVFQSISGIELYMEATGAAVGSVDAVGNTWKPAVQGANDQGKYSVGTVIPGPTGSGSNDNFVIANQGWSLHL